MRRGSDKKRELRRGEIAANIYAAGKPVRLFATAPAGTGLHFIPIPSNQEIEKVYVPGGLLTHAEYPTLVPEDAPVETVGVGVTLAVFGWQPSSVRSRNLVSFVDAFFTKFPELLKPPHHPAWHNVNLVAAQPGWIRFPAAEAWLAQHRPAARRSCRCENAGAIRGLSYAARRSATDTGAERGDPAIFSAATGTGALEQSRLEDFTRRRNWAKTG